MRNEMSQIHEKGKGEKGKWETEGLEMREKWKS